MLNEVKLLLKHGKQYIPDIQREKLPNISRGRPIIEKGIGEKTANFLINLCPTQAIQNKPFRIDLGKCLFCNECALALPEKIKFTNDYKLATNDTRNLIIKEGEDKRILFNEKLIRNEIKNIFGKSLKLRQISAGGDNSCELELNACGNVNFDMGRFGIEFTASPRHADGIVITGPITENMAEAIKICYEAVPAPKIVVLFGVDAISGGIFSGSKSLNREFIENVSIDLYIPGNPPHPLTFINGILELIRNKNHTFRLNKQK